MARKTLGITLFVARGWHARYLAGATVAAIGAGENPPLARATIYYYFERYGLWRVHHRAAQAEARKSVKPIIAPKKPFAGPPIYRSEFIRGDAVAKMTAGR